MSFLDRILAMNAAQSGAAFTAERPTAETALSGGRHPVLPDPRPHTVLGTPITGPWRDGQEHIVLGLGCFWGAEKLLWQIDGVESRSAPAATPNPTYREVLPGSASEVADVTMTVVVSVREILKMEHDPTQGDRQGNDVAAAPFAITRPAPGTGRSRRSRGGGSTYGERLRTPATGRSPRRSCHCRARRVLLAEDSSSTDRTRARRSTPPA